MLEEAMEDFAAHLRAYGEPRLASAVEAAKEGEPERLPQRVIGLFRQGMGGLLDVPLYTDGVLDTGATERRDELAEQMFKAAQSRLGSP